MRSVVVAAGALALTVSPAAAQLIRPVAGSGQVGVEVDGERTGSRASSLEARQWLQLGFAGGLMGERLLAYRITFRPGWQQGSLTGVDGDLGGRTLGLTASAALLPGRPISLVLGANRASGTTGAGFGNSRTFATGAQTADLTWANRFFPMRLAMRNQFMDDTWRYGDGSPSRPLVTRQQVVRLTASSSKTSFALERQWFDDRVRNEDFTAWSMLATHTLRWGHGSYLETLIDRSSQNGTRGTSRSSLGERLHLRHSTVVSSNWSWRRSQTALRDRRSGSTAFDGTLSWRFSGWGSASLQGGLATAGGSAAYRTTRLTPRLGLNLPVGPLRAGASFAAGGEWRRATAEGDTIAQVVDERQTVGPDRAILLEQPRAVASSLLLRGPDGSQYVEGLDYRVVPFGDRIRVEFPVDSRVPDGTTVSASYSYTIPSMSRNAARLDADVWVNWDGISLRYAATRRSVPAVAEQADAFRESRLSLNIRRPTPVGRLGFGVSLNARESGGQASTSAAEVNVDLARPLGPSVSVSGGADWSRAAVVGDSAVVVRSARAGLAWRATTTVRTQLHATATGWKNFDGVRQNFIAITTNVDWRFAGMDIHARWDATRRAQGQVLWLHRFSANLVRRF